MPEMSEKRSGRLQVAGKRKVMAEGSAGPEEGSGGMMSSAGATVGSEAAGGHAVGDRMAAGVAGAVVCLASESAGPAHRCGSASSAEAEADVQDTAELTEEAVAEGEQVARVSEAEMRARCSTVDSAALDVGIAAVEVDAVGGLLRASLPVW